MQQQYFVAPAPVQPQIIGYEMTGEGWCWVVILLIFFWPLAWIPCVCDSCKRPVYAVPQPQYVVAATPIPQQQAYVVVRN